MEQSSTIADRGHNNSFSFTCADEYDYASHFCEENIYKLAERFADSGATSFADGYVVFVSSRDQAVPLFMQKLARNITAPVIWDYHVIFIVKRRFMSAEEKSSGAEERHLFADSEESTGSIVFDFDSVLPFGCSASTYVSSCFPSQFCCRLKPGKQPLFRVVHYSQYLQFFASDRSHMVASGLPFPAWPAIKSSIGEIMNLFSYIEMIGGDTTQEVCRSATVDSAPDPSLPFGIVMSLEQFRGWVGVHSS